MASPLAFIPMLTDPLGGILLWGSAGLIAAILAAALLGMALNALHRAAGNDGRPHAHSSSPPADRNFRAAA